MITRLIIMLLLLTFFSAGCASYAYRDNPDYYCADCAINTEYYVFRDRDWHITRCDPKTYSYTKIKKIDFPVDYRAKYAECLIQPQKP